MQYKDLITLSDLTKLTKDQLLDIATDMSLKEATPATQFINMATAIYNKAKNNSEAGQVIETKKDFIFAGRGSVSWYRVDRSDSKTEKDSKVNILDEYINFLKNKDEKHPFDECKLDDEYLRKAFSGIKNTTPILLGAIDDNDKIFMRYTIKSGIRTDVGLFEAKEVPKMEIVTVLLIPDKSLIEIRTSSRSATKIHKAIVADIKENVYEKIQSSQISFKEDLKTEDPVNYFATKLHGTVVENVDIPSKIYETMTDDEKESISQILLAVDERLNPTEGTDDTDVNSTIDNARGSLANNFAGVSFTELILNGLTKVDLSSLKELLNTPLYTSLSNHLTTKTTYIQFPITINGSTENVTIRIGLTMNTVVFSSSSTEKAISAVRNVLN